MERDKRGYVLTGQDLLRDGDLPQGWQLGRSPLLMETSMPGVFAVGDVRRGSVKRVASAVGAGAIAIQGSCANVDSGDNWSMREGSIGEVDRLSVRTRPRGWPIMYQSWGKLLFMHWRIPAELLRPLIPNRLAIDTFDGSAWIGITPFTMWGVRPVFTPPLPALSRSHELNVRTYVHLDGVPGVWFFSLDASNAIAALGARLAFHLPYFHARMGLKREGRTIHFTSSRTGRVTSPTEFDATWTVGDRLPQSHPGSLEFFLTERYCLYSARGEYLYRARIFHRPWPLHGARLLSCRSTMIESQGLPSPRGAPLLHQQGEPLRVEIWPRVRV